MEVLYRNQPVFGAQPAAMVYPSAATAYTTSLSSRMFASPSEAFTCYPFDSPAVHSPQPASAPHTPPSRSPTPPEYRHHHHHSHHHHHNNHHNHQRPSSSMSSSSSNNNNNDDMMMATTTTASHQGTTLKSVLRGEVPEAYSHFMSSGHSSAAPSDPKPHPHQHQHPHHQQHQPSSSSSSSAAIRLPSPPSSSSSSLLGKRRSPFAEVDGSHSPSSLSRGSASVLSPPPEYVQTEPMDLSLKRPSSTASSSAGCSSSSASASPASFHHTFPPSPAEDHHPSNGQGSLGQSASEFSLLRNLLQVGKFLPASGSHHHQQPLNSYSSSSPSASASDRSCDSPCSDSGFGGSAMRHVCGATRVTLAKKNMYPVTARVSDWLVKVVQFANSIQVFREELSYNDRLTLVLNSWSRLLLLLMAESNFQFAVTPLRSEPEASESMAEGGPSPDEPTMKSVEGVQTFIRKCQHMGVEADEYYYLRMLVLFNSSYVGLSEPSKVDGFNSQIQQSLQEHVQRTRPHDIMHYSRLLMCLPSLYGISAKMVESLFCRHIDNISGAGCNSNNASSSSSSTNCSSSSSSLSSTSSSSVSTDMDVLLKELLQAWSGRSSPSTHVATTHPSSSCTAIASSNTTTSSSSSSLPSSNSAVCSSPM